MPSLIYKSREDSFLLHVGGEEIYLDYAEVERAYLSAKKRREDEERKFAEKWKQQQIADALLYEEF